MSKFLCVGHATVLSLLVAATACSNPTEAPAGRFNAERLDAGVSAVNRVASSALVSSLAAIGQSAGATAGAAAGRIPDAVSRIATTTIGAGSAMLPLMRPGVLGKTFVYVPAAGRYEVDPARSGAPSNGVRFILYETDIEGRPIVDRPIGYADLTDERRSAPSGVGLLLTVVTNGVTRLSYTLDVSGPLGALVFDVRGYVSNGADRLDFVASASPQVFGTGPATLDATLTISGMPFSVTTHAAGIPGAPRGDGTVNLTVASATDRVQIVSTTRSDSVDASVTVNGQLVATATGKAEAPVVRGKDGRELTADELTALGALVELSGKIFSIISDLLRPVGALLVIALGLGA
ncbi:MAG: hypothetical protein U0163_04945 [Gemmatimonadaceae bacterium]